MFQGNEIYKENYYIVVLVVDYDRLSRGDVGQQDRIKKYLENLAP